MAGMFPKGEADLVHHLMAKALQEVRTVNYRQTRDRGLSSVAIAVFARFAAHGVFLVVVVVVVKLLVYDTIASAGFCWCFRCVFTRCDATVSCAPRWVTANINNSGDVDEPRNNQRAPPQTLLWSSP